MIDVAYLTKSYDRVLAVDDLSFQVGPGEILGMVGPNGARGRNLLIRDGTRRELDGHVALDVRAGEIVRIETPGGGGYNPKP